MSDKTTIYKPENDGDLVTNYVRCPTCKATITQLENAPSLECQCDFWKQHFYEEPDEEEFDGLMF